MTLLRFSGFDGKSIFRLFVLKIHFFVINLNFLILVNLPYRPKQEAKRILETYLIERSEKLEKILVNLSHRAKREAENIILSEERGLRKIPRFIFR